MGSSGSVKTMFGDIFDLILMIITERKSFQVIRYGIANIVSFIIDFAILFILTDIAGFNYLISAAISYMTGICVLYLISIIWVFNQFRFKSKLIEISGFILIGVAGMGLNTALLWLLTDMAGMYYLWSRCISAVVGFFAKYLARKYKLFSEPSSGGQA
jgi:putative flippase GtrA